MSIKSARNGALQIVDASRISFCDRL